MGLRQLGCAGSLTGPRRQHSTSQSSAQSTASRKPGTALAFGSWILAGFPQREWEPFTNT